MDTDRSGVSAAAGEIVDDFVLLEASILLSDAELNIAEIANELHFSDQSFFGKFLRGIQDYHPNNIAKHFKRLHHPQLILIVEAFVQLFRRIRREWLYFIKVSTTDYIFHSHFHAPLPS